jgi:hypothetical protein
VLTGASEIVTLEERMITLTMVLHTLFWIFLITISARLSFLPPGGATVYWCHTGMGPEHSVYPFVISDVIKIAAAVIITTVI